MGAGGIGASGGSNSEKLGMYALHTKNRANVNRADLRPHVDETWRRQQDGHSKTLKGVRSSGFLDFGSCPLHLSTDRLKVCVVAYSSDPHGYRSTLSTVVAHAEIDTNKFFDHNGAFGSLTYDVALLPTNPGMQGTMPPAASTGTAAPTAEAAEAQGGGTRKPSRPSTPAAPGMPKKVVKGVIPHVTSLRLRFDVTLAEAPVRPDYIFRSYFDNVARGLAPEVMRVDVDLCRSGEIRVGPRETTIHTSISSEKVLPVYHPDRWNILDHWPREARVDSDSVIDILVEGFDYIEDVSLRVTFHDPSALTEAAAAGGAEGKKAAQVSQVKIKGERKLQFNKFFDQQKKDQFQSFLAKHTWKKNKPLSVDTPPSGSAPTTDSEGEDEAYARRVSSTSQA